LDLGILTGVLVLSMSTPIAVATGMLAWRNRTLPGARSFLVVIVLAFWWAYTNAIESLVPSLEVKLLWANLGYVSITLLPVAWLAMAVEYAGRREWMSGRRLALFCVMPLVTNVLLWTDSYHHLVRTAAWLDTTGAYLVIGRTWGPWFWTHATYSYALFAAALTLLSVTIFAVPSWYRRKPIAVLIGSLIPLAANLIDTLVPSSTPIDDLTPAVFGLSALVLAWGLLRLQVFDVIPAARYALVENMQDGVLVLDHSGQVVDLNKSAQRLMGRPASQIVGRPLAESWHPWEQVVAPYEAGADHAQIRLGDPENRRNFEVKWSPLIRRKQVIARVVVLTDVTERVLLEESLRDQALTDGLTGLPNRALFMSKLDDAIHRAKRHETELFAVLVLDLDHFKLVNDRLGHLAGDILLQSVATKLQRCIRETDVVARMGGDEFVLLVSEISSQRDLVPVLNRIWEELRAPVYFRQQEVAAAASVGVVLWDAAYRDADDLVRAADTAMYQAKQDGRGCHRIFDEEMHKAVLQTLHDETELRAAIRERAFSLTYQPIVDLKTGAVRSLEALLRWQHPERGTVFPRDFLSVAESSGLILPLGSMAMDEVCAQLSRWQSPRQRISELPVSVNISPRQLTEPDFVASVLGRLTDWRIPSDRLMLEITENALVRDPPKARQAMRKLKGLGLRICLDDFGAGGSSLHHLLAFPVQELKIDPSFISGIAKDRKNLEIVRSLVALAHTLGLEVTAEGVEQKEQWALLKEVGCDGAQGYFIGSPMESDVLIDFLEDLEPGGGVTGQDIPGASAVPSPGASPQSRDQDVHEPAARRPVPAQEA
jgi:diguanylate cyclase (GGDEF)-like protein/PAS domain S-box-containing protein